MTYNFNPPERLLMGPGPSMVSPRVLSALARPTLGHLDPEFLQILNEISDMLREVFGTTNQVTFPVSGTGSAGMETVFVNLIQPDDRVLVCVNGVFGERMKDVATRCGAEVVTTETKWGGVFTPEQIEEAFYQHGPFSLVAIVHAETSTGALQPLKEIGEIVRCNGALFVVDAVTSLGGVPVNVDENLIDACYSGTQKCLSVPPGLAPVTFGPRALEAMERRSHKVQSWYLDISMIIKYLGSERVYHHTAPINMLYALHQGLAMILEEGLEQVYRRHLRLGRELQDRVEAMGLTLFVDREIRMPQLTTICVPDDIDEARIRSRLLKEYNIEIGGGMGRLKGKIWRVGLMGSTATRRNVVTFLSALEELL